MIQVFKSSETSENNESEAFVGAAGIPDGFILKLFSLRLLCLGRGCWGIDCIYILRTVRLIPRHFLVSCQEIAIKLLPERNESLQRGSRKEL